MNKLFSQINFFLSWLNFVSFLSNPTFKRLMNITWAILTTRFDLFFIIHWSWIYWFNSNLKQHMKSPLWKFKRSYFIEHLWTTASILKTVWSKRQPLRLFCKKRCSLGFRKFHRKWAYFRVFFNEAVSLMARTFIEERLKRRSFPVRFSKMFFFFFFFFFFWCCILIIDDVINGYSYHLFKQATLVPYFLWFFISNIRRFCRWNYTFFFLKYFSEFFQILYFLHYP